MRTPEGYEKADVDKFLENLGPELVWWIKPFMAGFGKAGVPDYCICLDGAFWALEIKRPGKNPTVLQGKLIREIEHAGGHCAAGTAEVVIQAMTDWLEVRGIVV